jgi:hypothetical protein
MKKALEEALAALPTMKWLRIGGPADASARFLHGECSTWTALVADFSIVDQGFPVGSRGYDGTATKKSEPLILHLPREAAQAAFEKAIKEVENEEGLT